MNIRERIVRVFTLFLTFSIVISCLQTTAVADLSDCNRGNHTYEQYRGVEISDICSVCGHPRPPHKCDREMPFVTIDRDGGVIARAEPRETGAEVHRYYEAGTKLMVKARIRNEHNNLWLELSDGSWVFVDRVAFDFDSFVKEEIDFIGPHSLAPQADAKNLLRNFKIWCITERDVAEEWVDWIAMMWYAFHDEGGYDVKQPDLLGNRPEDLDNSYLANKYVYKIYSNGVVQPKALTGKEIGNVLYGYVCSHYNVTYTLAMQFTGVEILNDLLNELRDEGNGLFSKLRSILNAFDRKDRCLATDINACDDSTGVDYSKIGYWVEKNQKLGAAWDYSLRNFDPDVRVTYGYNIWSNGESELPSISDEVVPQGTLPYGQPFNLRGIISSSTAITNVTANIFNSQNASIANYSVNPNKTVYDIYSDGLNFQSPFKFGTFPSGSYRYVVSATNAAGTKELINSSFNIGDVPQGISVSRYEDCYVSLKCPTTRAVNLYVNPTDSSRFTYFSKGQEPISYRKAYMSDGSTWYEVGANHNGQEMKLWLKYESDIIITDLSTPSYNPPEEIHQSVEEDSSPDWSSWSDTFASPSDTLEVETRRVVDVEGHTEYRYGRWIGPTVNWCKEYGQSKNGGSYSIQYSDWSVYRAYDTGTNWTCGCFDSQHSSHIGSIGPDSRGYPMWRKYNVSGYGNPDFFWEETRWVDTTYKTQYRTRRIELPLTLQVTLMLYDQNSIDTKLICTEGQPYGELPNPTRDGYTFDGWYTLEIGGDQITSSSIFGKESAQILFAHWTPVPPKIYTVSFDTNGGYGDTTSIYVTENETYGTLPTPVRTDYSFDGWFTSSVGGSLITSSTPVNLSGPQTLYAHWTKKPAKTFTVSFDSVGGTVNTSTITVTNGETYGTLPLPQKQGYTFDGWYTSGLVQILSSSVVNLSGNQTLYAHWTRIPVKTFTVSFNPEGGTVSTSSITVTNGEAYGTMPLPQKQGYTFTGWYTNDSMQVLSSTIVNLSGNQTLYAHWTKNETTMSFVDVSPYNYFYDAVSWAVENHVTKGTTTTTFSPHATCTKAHIITFLWRAFGSPEPTINKTFVDVDDGKYYAKAAVWAYEKGLVSGDTFGGGNLCTRASAVLFLWQIAGSPEAKKCTFDDVLQDAKYADAVSWAVSEGITNGTTNTTFDPHQICSRGHIVTFLWRYFVQ